MDIDECRYIYSECLAEMSHAIENLHTKTFTHIKKYFEESTEGTESKLRKCMYDVKCLFNFEAVLAGHMDKEKKEMHSVQEVLSNLLLRMQIQSGRQVHDYINSLSKGNADLNAIPHHKFRNMEYLTYQLQGNFLLYRMHMTSMISTTQYPKESFDIFLHQNCWNVIS